MLRFRSTVAVRAYRNRIIRALVRAAIPVSARKDLVRLGTQYGGWWVPERALRAGGIAYCAGVGDDISFDISLTDRYGLEVWAFDPTPGVIDAVAEWEAPERWHFEPVGLWDREEVTRFYAPPGGRGSLSATNARKTSEFVYATVEPLHKIMKRLGHNHLDLLKMDIEGAEGRVLASMIEHDIRPVVLCVEFDEPEPPWRTRRRIRDVLAYGYLLLKIDHWNVTFVRVDE
jgi:FkbM family methyltransferase